MVFSVIQRGKKERGLAPSGQPLIIQYTNLLHQCRDCNAPGVRKFLRLNSGNKVFVQRARTLNQVFQLKGQLAEVGL